MSESHFIQPIRRPTLIGASLAALALALAACSSPSPSESAAASESTGASASEAASASQGAARCAVTADASPNATIEIASSAFGDEVTIQAGQAVTFTNQDGAGHTITEGTGGQAADDACVDDSIGGGQSVIVTFNEPGDYQITCKIHSSMQTVVHVE